MKRTLRFTEEEKLKGRKMWAYILMVKMKGNTDN